MNLLKKWKKLVKDIQTKLKRMKFVLQIWKSKIFIFQKKTKFKIPHFIFFGTIRFLIKFYPKFKNILTDRLEVEASIQEGTTTLSNKEQPINHSAAFKVLERDISKGSADQVDVTKSF